MAVENNSKANDKVLKAGAGYVIGNYLLKGITFLSAPIFTRLLSTEDFGNFNTYISYESIFYIIIGLALHSSINSAKYTFKEKFEEYISSIVFLTGISACIWLLLANVFYNLYGPWLDLSRPIVNILVLHCFGTSMFQFFNTYVSLNYGVKSFMTMTSINALSNMILSVVLIVTMFSSNRYLGRIIGTVVPIVLIAIYIVFYFFKKSKPSMNYQFWRYGVIYSLPIIPHGISQVILSSFDRIMIKNMVGAAESGLYSFSYTIYALVKVVATSLDNVWKPWIYEKMNAKEYPVIRKQASKYAFGMALFTAIVLMVAPEIVMILGAREYWGATNCVVPVVVGGYFSFIYTLPVMIEYYYEKTKYIAMGSIFAAVINIVLNYLFIPKYGYIAAAYTTLITYCLYFIFHFVLAKKIHGESLFSGIQLFCICLAVVIIGVITLLLEKKIIVRWSIEVMIITFGIFWAEKNFLLLKRIKRGR